MEAEYDEVLHWVDPGPAVPGEAAASSETPWGEGIQLAGVVQPLKGRQTSSLMVDSYGFQSQGELLRVQKYLKDHGGWQLEQVSYRPKRLVACHSLWSLAILNLLVACRYICISCCMSVGKRCQKLHVRQHQEGAGGLPSYRKAVPLFSDEIFQMPGGKLVSGQ